MPHHRPIEQSENVLANCIDDSMTEISVISNKLFETNGLFNEVSRMNSSIDRCPIESKAFSKLNAFRAECESDLSFLKDKVF